MTRRSNGFKPSSQFVLLMSLLWGLLTPLFMPSVIPPALAKAQAATATTKPIVSALTDAQQQAVTQWEQQLLGISFPQEADVRRIGRLESALFGKNKVAQTARLPLAERLTQLANTIADTQPKYPASLIAAVEKQQDAKVQQGESIVFDGQRSKNPPLQNEEALPKLEKKLIGTIFTNDTTENRLRRLEAKVFSASPNDEEPVSNQQRLDRLIAVSDANPRGGIGDLKRDKFLKEALPIILTSFLLIL